jgi:hypothetical protein
MDEFDWQAWFKTPAGVRYLARRMFPGAKRAIREQAALEAWFAGRPG